MLTPEQQAARIIAHYLKHLTLISGRRRTTANDRDMALLGQLLGVEAVEDDDTIPPYEAPVVSDRVTQSFERDQAPYVHRYEDDDYDITQRRPLRQGSGR
jgi:hypothetical protein